MNAINSRKHIAGSFSEEETRIFLLGERDIDD